MPTDMSPNLATAIEILRLTDRLYFEGEDDETYAQLAPLVTKPDFRLLFTVSTLGAMFLRRLADASDTTTEELLTEVDAAALIQSLEKLMGKEDDDDS